MWGRVRQTLTDRYCCTPFIFLLGTKITKNVHSHLPWMLRDRLAVSFAPLAVPISSHATFLFIFFISSEQFADCVAQIRGVQGPVGARSSPALGASPGARRLQLRREGGHQARVVRGRPRTSRRPGRGLHAHVVAQRQVGMAVIQHRLLIPVQSQGVQLPWYLDRTEQKG